MFTDRIQNNSQSKKLFRPLDWPTILMYLALIVCGWISIYGATYDYDMTDSVFSFATRTGKQMVWIGAGLIIALVISLMDAKFYDMLANIFYFLMIGLLIITPILAKDTKGSLSWIEVGSVKIQPAEFAKVATALALAKYMSKYGYKVKSLKDLLWPAIILLAPMLIIMGPQKETGSALVFASMFLMFYREGMSGIILLIGMAAVSFFVLTVSLGESFIPIGIGNYGIIISMTILQAVLTIYLLFFEYKQREALYMLGSNLVVYLLTVIISIWFPLNINAFAVVITIIDCGYLFFLSLSSRNAHKIWILIGFTIVAIGYCYSTNYIINNVLQEHQRNRIKVTLNMVEDNKGQGYNVNQSKIAIGSGGLFGKGFLQGTQTKLKYVPEQETDFIFCTVGEEHGFVGCCFVLVLYMALLLRIVSLAEKQTDSFNRIYGYCVACIFFFHLAINVGMVIGIVPVIGIPLPLFSYGGSSLWSFTMLLFIFLSLDANRTDKQR